MKLKLIIWALFLLHSAIALGNTRTISENRFLFKHISLTVGNWYEFVGDVQVNDNGESNSLLDFQLTPFIAISADHEFQPGWALIPEIGYVIRRQAGDESIVKDQFFVRLDVAWTVWERLRLRLGTSTMLATMSGDGGEESLPNGDSTQTFYRPDQRSTAVNQTLDLGAEYLWKNMSARFQSYIYSLDEQEKRMISYSLSFNYYIPLEKIL